MILPVKPPAIGKSRLTGLPDDVRRRLAGAFALDTARAALMTPGVTAVLAVTDDYRFASQLRELGCEVIPDGTTTDLNVVLVQAAAEAVRRWEGAWPVVLCADLPTLRSEELAEVLDALPPDSPGFVRDSSGTGTTVYGAPVGLFAPSFGPGSAGAHVAAGAQEVVVPAPTVRHDVDDVEALNVARELGLGPHTRAIEVD